MGIERQNVIIIASTFNGSFAFLAERTLSLSHLHNTVQIRQLLKKKHTGHLIRCLGFLSFN